MAYLALYRKLRPQTFKDVIGQQAIVRTLRNQLTAGRVSHAYLFCGTRGTGKTTTAKIFARAVNCLNPQEGEPCNACVVCVDILEGRSVNVAEIDAASNNGVDNIRDIREEVKYPPTEGNYMCRGRRLGDPQQRNNICRGRRPRRPEDQQRNYPNSISNHNNSNADLSSSGY